MKRKPDFQIPGYLNRWHLIPRNKWFNVYLHQFIGPDPSAAWHDHPWWSLTIKLRGDYVELRRVYETGICELFGCRVVIRSAAAPHSITRVMSSIRIVPPVCWTLFITGPVVRDWGFWVNGEWVKHTDYLDPIHDGEMPSPPPKMSAITKARLMGAHVAFAGRFTRGPR